MFHRRPQCTPARMSPSKDRLVVLRSGAARAGVLLCLSLLLLAYGGCGRQPQSVLERGKEHFSKMQFAEAEKCFEQHLEQVPEDAETWTLLGKTQLALEKAQEADASFSRALDLDSENASLYLARSTARERLGDTQGATEDYQRARELHSDYRARLDARMTEDGDNRRRDTARADLEAQLASDDPASDASRGQDSLLDRDADSSEAEADQLGWPGSDGASLDSGTASSSAPPAGPTAVEKLLGRSRTGALPTAGGLLTPSPGAGTEQRETRAPGLLNAPRTTVPPGLFPLGPNDLQRPPTADVRPSVRPRLSGSDEDGATGGMIAPNTPDDVLERPPGERPDTQEPPGPTTPPVQRYAIPPGSFELPNTAGTGTSFNPLYPPSMAPADNYGSPGAASGVAGGVSGIRRDRDLAGPTGSGSTYRPYADSDPGGYYSGGEAGLQQTPWVGDVEFNGNHPNAPVQRFRQGEAPIGPLVQPAVGGFGAFFGPTAADYPPYEGTGYYQPRYDFNREDWKMVPLDRVRSFKFNE